MMKALFLLGNKCEENQCSVRVSESLEIIIKLYV